MKQAFLVDDSKSARIVLGRLLKKNGFDEVAMAESGEQALEQLKAITPDAIFVDFLMDGMDGLETIMEIKKDPRFDATPVVMCTANVGDEYVRAAVDHGALGILAKPPTDESLGEIIALIEQHQREQAVSNAAQAPVSESRKPEPRVVEVAAETVSQRSPATGLSEQDVRRIAREVAMQSAGQAAAGAAASAVAEGVGSAVSAYLDKTLAPMVSRLVEQRFAEFKPPEIDTTLLRDQVAQSVNQDLEESVRKLNQRIVEGLIEASIYEQITEVANDFSQRLADAEQRILLQVPEKNEMIEHIRVVTEGSIESQVRETATQVAQEISNAIATETVENLMDQRLSQQSEENGASNGSLRWVLLLLGAAVIGVGFYYFYLA